MLDGINRLRGAALAAMIGAAAFIGATADARAQAYPSKPITLIVPYAAGGIVDLVARQTATYMEPFLNGHFVVENRVGASGAIGTGAVAKAKPDGYTIGVVGLSAMSLLPVMDSTLPYDPLKDIASIGMITDNETILVARPDFPANNFQEFLAVVRANPGKFFYGTAGAGGASQLIMEDLKSRLNFDIKNAPYAGDSEALTALMGKYLDLEFVALGSSVGPVKDGRIKAFAIGAVKRSKALPNVPTFSEVGVPGDPIVNFSAFGAPAGTPQAIIDKLNEALNKALQNPQFLTWIEQQGLSVRGGKPEELDKSVRSSIKVFEKVVTDLKLPRK